MKRLLLKLLWVSIVAGSIGGLVPTPVLAQTAPTCAEDPFADPACTASVTTTTTVERDPLAPAGGGCRARTQKILAESIVGINLWAYFQRVSWCFRNGRITDIDRTRWAEVYAPGWDFRGHIGSSLSGGVGTRAFTYFTQGKFTLCVVYCLQTKTPWIRQTGRSDGSYAVSTGG